MSIINFPNSKEVLQASPEVVFFYSPTKILAVVEIDGKLYKGEHLVEGDDHEPDEYLALQNLIEKIPSGKCFQSHHGIMERI